jgi:hypothetical protein
MKEASAMVGLSPTTFWSLAQPQQWPTTYFAERDPHKPRHDFADLGVTGVIAGKFTVDGVLATAARKPLLSAHGLYFP